MASLEKIKFFLLLLFAVAHILISLIAIIPGYISIDEITYHLMTKNFSESGGFEIWNGYREYPSPELESNFIFARNGRLVSQYPYLYPILCMPFYRIWGYHGLFFVNVISFLGIATLCYASAQKLFNDRNLALNSCFILALATFLWEYSQAAWPHATATLFIMAAFYIFTCSFNEKTPRIALLLSLACGFISGFAAGIRLDSIFVVPCFIFLFLFVKPWRPRLALAVCIGTLPGLLILSATNYVKFGVLSPLSYGRSFESSLGILEIKPYLPFAGLIAFAIIILWVLRRYPLGATLRRYKRSVIIMIILLIITLAMSPMPRKTFKKPLNGAYQLIVDLRVRDLDIKEGGLSRSQGGGMVYLGGLKKSLLQSCPYLVVLLLPFLRIFRRDREYIQLIILFLIPIVFISFYSYHNAWHGGLSLNLRYFIPILPFTSILSAYAWRELAGNLNWHWGRLSILLCFLITYVFLFQFQRLETAEQREFLFLTAPLLLALLLITILIIRIKFPKLNQPLVSSVIVATILIAMAWSGFIALFYDYPLARRHRKYNLYIAKNAEKVVTNNSILFTNDPEPFFGLIKKGRVRIANPGNDNYNDIEALIAFHLQKGHSVYTAFNKLLWEKIQNKGLLDSFRVIPIEFDQKYIFSLLTLESG